MLSPFVVDPEISTLAHCDAVGRGHPLHQLCYAAWPLKPTQANPSSPKPAVPARAASKATPLPRIAEPAQRAAFWIYLPFAANTYIRAAGCACHRRLANDPRLPVLNRRSGPLRQLVPVIPVGSDACLMHLADEGGALIDRGFFRETVIAAAAPGAARLITAEKMSAARGARFWPRPCQFFRASIRKRAH